MTDTNSKSCWDEDSFKEKLEKRIDGECEEGKRIGKYLCKIIPNWRCMESKYLYEQIRWMLKNAEEIRRFEIDFVWKRGVYIISLMALFFTAFGGVFYIIFGTDVEGHIIAGFLYPIMLLVALANTFLSFCLAMINVHSHRWQENWEYHVDYLQSILGIRLMRACLKKKVKCYTIRDVNIYVGFFIFGFWLSLSLILLLINLDFEELPVIVLFCAMFLFAIGFTVHAFRKCVTKKGDVKKKNNVNFEEMDIRILQKIAYFEEEYDLESKPDSP